MLDRFNPWLRIICLVFAGLMFFQVSHLFIWKNPLADAVIPQVASVATNLTVTNASSTNVLSTNMSVGKGTSNQAAVTNIGLTNIALTNAAGTNANPTKLAATNAIGTNATSTNAMLAKSMGTNGTSTNAAPGHGGSKDLARGNPPPGAGPRAMNPGMRGPGMPDMSLPSLIQSRIDRIIQSEILGAVIHPPPMALLGIGGKDIFFRAPNGQTGLLRVGEELGGIKLLQIGPNRVLIEQDGQKKELTMFEGIGSESLLPK